MPPNEPVSELRTELQVLNDHINTLRSQLTSFGAPAEPAKRTMQQLVRTLEMQIIHIERLWACVEVVATEIKRMEEREDA